MASRTLAVLAAVALVGCGRPGDRGAGPHLAACRVRGLPREVECGAVSVPESPEEEGARLPLRIVRVPARHPTAPREALFLLAGGPGQAATEAFPPLWHAFAGIAESRDVVLVDVRGTGASGPLDCPEDDDLTLALRGGSLLVESRRCREALRGRRFDGFATATLAADLEVVRGALGYERIDLLGVSYGTRLALAYAAAHPERVASLVLDGVAPPSLVLGATFARDASAALEGVLDDCAADAACRAAYPDARTRLGALLEGLPGIGAEPRLVEVRHPDDGRTLRVPVDRAGLAAALRGLLYAPELAALLPLTLSEVEDGRFDGLFGQVAFLGREGARSTSAGLLFAIACAEDVPRITDADREHERAARLDAALLDDLRAACSDWSVPARPLAELAAPLAMPTLVLSGARDPATPPRHAETLLPRLPRGRHVVVPEAGHGVWGRGCVPDLVERFLERRDATELDVSCAAAHRRPAFFVDRGGPRE